MRRWITGCFVGLILGLAGVSLAQIQTFPAQTDGHFRSLISGTAPIAYDNTTGIISFSAGYTGQGTITTLGTIGTGVWQGTSIATGFTDAKVVSVSCATITCSGTNPASFSVGGGVITNAMLAGSITASNLVGTDIATLGTITAGIWNGGTIPILYGGTGQTTANNAFNALAPSQVGAANKVLKSDGTDTSWTAALVSSVTGTASRITTSPTTGDVVVDISNAYVGQASITTLGTVTTGTWNGSVVGVTWGGTGLASLTANHIPYGNGTSPFQSSTNLTFDGTSFAVGTAGPHAIGGATSTLARLRFLGTWTGTPDAYGAEYGGSLQPTGAGNDSYATIYNFTATAPAAGAGGIAAAIRILPPNLSGSWATNVGLYISAAPTGATNNYAIWVVAGTTRLGGLLAQAAGNKVVCADANGNLYIGLNSTACE